jgi:hypothetical protein
MLTSTFIHIQGIGYATERRIWEMGARTWSHYLDMHPALPLAQGKKSLILPVIEESASRLENKDYAYFGRVLPAKEHWRAVSEFGDDLAYLDIETTGCGYEDGITIIGLYDGYDMQTFIRGENLADFPEAVSRYRVLVTFFGSGFDLPFIRRTFPDLRLDQLHVDLCHLLRRLGFSGGLKRIEGQLGIRRRPETEGLDGYDAVRLWNEHLRGSEEALDLLLLYNKEDVMNMESLLAHGCAEMAKKQEMPLIA